MSILSPIIKACGLDRYQFLTFYCKKNISKLKQYLCERLGHFSFGTASVQGKPWFQFRAPLMLRLLNVNIKTNYSFLKKRGKKKKTKKPNKSSGSIEDSQ